MWGSFWLFQKAQDVVDSDPHLEGDSELIFFSPRSKKKKKKNCLRVENRKKGGKTTGTTKTYESTMATDHSVPIRVCQRYCGLR